MGSPVRPVADLMVDIDSALTGRPKDTWPTIVELIDILGTAWNKNPTRTGAGFASEYGPEMFDRYAYRMRSKGYTYPEVFKALSAGRYATGEVVREVRGVKGGVLHRSDRKVVTVRLTTWGPR